MPGREEARTAETRANEARSEIRAAKRINCDHPLAVYSRACSFVQVPVKGSRAREPKETKTKAVDVGGRDSLLPPGHPSGKVGGKAPYLS